MTSKLASRRRHPLPALASLVAALCGISLGAVACKNAQNAAPQTTRAESGPDMPPATQLPTLEEQLVDRSFGDYFLYPAYETTLDNIWDAQPGPEPLQALIKDANANTLARLIAAEVLYRIDLMHLQGAGMKNVAEVYVKALREDVTGFANSWGLLWENDDLGPQGKNLRMCGRAANAPLLPLLDDTTVRDNYQGSEEATVGNAAGFRVKDFAAFYLGKINNIAIEYHRDVAARDAAIEKLREQLK